MYNTSAVAHLSFIRTRRLPEGLVKLEELCPPLLRQVVGALAEYQKGDPSQRGKLITHCTVIVIWLVTSYAGSLV